MLYVWHNNSDEIDTGALPEWYSITSSGDPANAVNDLLVITGLSRQNAGSYACLEPLYTPDHASPGADQTVVAGDDVTLSCSADDHGRPDGSWIWMTPGGSVVNTSDVGQLTITEVTMMNDDGEYSCHLNNHVGNGARGYGTVTVFDGPSILSFEEVTPSGPINQHDDVTFLCQTDSRPMPVIYLIRPSGDTLVSSSTSNSLEHTLADIDCLDSGYYKCVAFNACTGRIRSTLLPLTVQSLQLAIHWASWKMWSSLLLPQASLMFPPSSEYIALMRSASRCSGHQVGMEEGNRCLLSFTDALKAMTATPATDISDTGQYDTVTSKAAGMLPDTSYDFMVLATNQFASSPSRHWLLLQLSLDWTMMGACQLPFMEIKLSSSGL